MKLELQFMALQPRQVALHIIETLFENFKYKIIQYKQIYNFQDKINN